MKKSLKMMMVAILGVAMLSNVVLTGCSQNNTDGSSSKEELPVSLDRYECALKEGETYTLTFTDSSGGIAVWTSSDESVATVDQSGKIVALKKGTAEITVTIGEEWATCYVTVEEAVAIAPTFDLGIKTTSMYVGGQAVALNPYVTMNGQELTKNEISKLSIAYQSSDENIATVDQQGLVTALSWGEVTIKASVTLNGVYFEDSVKVTVKDLIIVEPTAESITIGSPKTLTGADNSNGSATLGVKVFAGADFEEVKDAELSYESKNPDIVTVDAKTGVVKAVGEGSASIVAKYGDFEATVTVNVATAIASKADLDKLALAYLNNETELWSADASYVLTQDIDYNGEYIIPIAAYYGPRYGGGWGYWGAINGNNENSEGNPFYGTIDGNGHAIVNAVMPYASSYSAYCGIGNNFIGMLQGTLKNIAFKNIETENYAECIAAHPEYASKVNAYDSVGVHGMLGCILPGGLVENVYAEVHLKTATINIYHGGVLAAVVDGGAMKNCVTKVTAESYDNGSEGIVGRYWVSNHKDFLADIGLIAGINVGEMSNCFTIVENTEFKQVVSNSSVLKKAPYINLFQGSFYNAWIDNQVTNRATSGTNNNLGRYDSAANFMDMQSANLEAYGFNLTCWNAWLAE